MDLLSEFLIYTYYYGRPVVILAALVLSIVIICTKDRLTKLIGIWMTVSAINAMLGAVYNLMIRYTSMEIIARLSVFNSVVTIVLGTVSSVVFVIYATKKYGLKLYLGIILIAGSSVIGVLLRVIFSNLLKIKDFDDAIRFGSFTDIIVMIPSLAVAVIWFIIFFRNRHKEKELKLLWLITLNSLVAIVFNFALDLYVYFAAVQDSVSAQQNQMTISLIESAIGMFVPLLFNIYVLVKGRKASEDDKLIIVEN